MTHELDTRPRPLADAASKVTKVTGVIGAFVTALVGFGILTALQDDAVQGLLGAIPGIVTLVTNALVAFGIVKKAEPKVTPMIDPKSDSGQPLVVVEGRVG